MNVRRCACAKTQNTTTMQMPGNTFCLTDGMMLHHGSWSLLDGGRNHDMECCNSIHACFSAHVLIQ